MPVSYLVAAACSAVLLAGPAAGAAVAQEIPAPHFKLTAADFAKEYAADRAAFEKKYKDKVVEVTGVVLRADRSGGGKGRGKDQVVLFLKGLDRMPGLLEFRFGDDVGCLFNDPAIDGTIGTGQTVTVRGWYQPILGPSLTACAVVDAGKSTVVRLTAAELAAEVSKDADATGKKYHGKTLVVTGEVAGIRRDANKAKYLELEGDGRLRIDCLPLLDMPDLPDQYKVGEKVAFVCELNKATKDLCQAHACRPLPKK